MFTAALSMKPLSHARTSFSRHRTREEDRPTETMDEQDLAWGKTPATRWREQFDEHLRNVTQILHRCAMGELTTHGRHHQYVWRRNLCARNRAGVRSRWKPRRRLRGKVPAWEDRNFKCLYVINTFTLIIPQKKIFSSLTNWVKLGAAVIWETNYSKHKISWASAK